MTETRRILADLVAFDTTSRNSNLSLIEYVRDYLARHGIESELFPSPEGDKANLWATIGPDAPGGLILSGHTDCVPVDGQDWTSDPFTLTERDGRLYGRGTCDMKGFLASVLAAVPKLSEAGLARPVHIAFSYDEELGSVGVRHLTAALAKRGARPALCLVGEPTGMGVVTGHKGGRSYRCTVAGMESHSSLAPLAVNAIEYAAELIGEIRRMGKELAAGPADAEFDVIHSTISTGLIDGGTAINIVPRSCSFTFEYRNLIDVDQDRIFSRIERFAREVLEPEMKKIAPDAGFSFEQIYDYPAHEIEADHPQVLLVKRLVQRNDHSKVAYGTEAGIFKRDLEVPTVICGPGSIRNAHMPDEFIDIEQLAACDAFIQNLVQAVACDAQEAPSGAVRT